ncbi:NADH dehydrogenase ubiquinone Fe-S protein 4 [Novosphingobium sp. G106]|uniref:NADH dehydrogenase ubiquinone Fe-S protein 4 n=1 Tax=Novosphingobium sp. G106 TaxID=2849500 RepID=UPI002810FDE4|nr:NADH dehydrogenase ubiquinone Fe-S protein 4 [Novosphingobium sp. G106]
MFAGFLSMERRHDRSARDFCPGPSANDNEFALSSGFPPDTRAIVEPVPLATVQGRRARRGQWRVRFRPRWGPSADTLTGWIGGGDPLDTIELRFADRPSAEGYCQRQGLAYTCAAETPGRKVPAPLKLPDAPPALCCWPTGPHQLCCGKFRLAS